MWRGRHDDVIIVIKHLFVKFFHMIILRRVKIARRHIAKQTSLIEINGAGMLFA